MAYVNQSALISGNNVFADRHDRENFPLDVCFDFLALAKHFACFLIDVAAIAQYCSLVQLIMNNIVHEL
jgi:hypothetical protein